MRLEYLSHTCTDPHADTTTCTTATAVSVVTAILVACVSVVIHIAVCAYCIKRQKTSHSIGDAVTIKTEAIYEEVPNPKVRNEVIEMKQNQVYSLVAS